MIKKSTRVNKINIAKYGDGETSPKSKPSFIMSELYDLWNEIYIND